MARAKVKRRNTPRNITVELTEGEADFVLGVTGLISGDNIGSPRKYADRVRRALTRALGYDETASDFFRLARGQIVVAPYGSPETMISEVMSDYSSVIGRLIEKDWMKPDDREMLRDDLREVVRAVREMKRGDVKDVPVSQVSNG